jgi:hypothetical protein
MCRASSLVGLGDGVATPRVVGRVSLDGRDGVGLGVMMAAIPLGCQWWRCCHPSWMVALATLLNGSGS